MNSVLMFVSVPNIYSVGIVKFLSLKGSLSSSNRKGGTGGKRMYDYPAKLRISRSLKLTAKKNLCLQACLLRTWASRAEQIKIDSEFGEKNTGMLNWVICNVPLWNFPKLSPLQNHKEQLPIPAKWSHSPVWFKNFLEKNTG